MNKKILFGIAALAIAAAAVLNVNFSSKNNLLSTTSLTNVEALASEIDSPIYGCIVGDLKLDGWFKNKWCGNCLDYYTTANGNGACRLW
jgi:hypothetical protein